MAETDFSAKEPSLGYYYQIRLSLLLLLTNEDMINPVIKIESLDDIEIQDQNKTNLYQTKLHINSVTNLTDRSSDFWKTVRVWSENIYKGEVVEENTIFTLITTAPVGADSFLNSFKQGRVRDSESIRIRMSNISSETSNSTNSNAYTAFRKLSTDQQLGLINNIVILDSSLSIESALSSLNNKLRYSAPHGKLDVFIEHVEGWWFQQCIHMLTNRIPHISNISLTQKISDIRDSFQLDNLPDDFGDPIQIKDDDLPDYEDRIFVRQLKLVAIKSNSLRNAISDFRRAYDQRSKWLREQLANLDEFERFEKQLKDHWNNIFSAMKDDCDGLPLNELERIGYDFYRKYYVERVPPIRIRERFASEYLTRGSCQMLSEDKKIGWHPDFENLLK